MRKISFFATFFPFFCFTIGYIACHMFIHTDEIILENVIGKTLQESIAILSHNNLNVRLLHEREDSVLPEGTVLDQIPKPFQHVKPNQSIFVTVSKKTSPLEVPDFTGQSNQEIVTRAEKLGIDLTTITISHATPQGRCIAQTPIAGSLFEKNQHMTIYCSSGNKQQLIIPSFINKPLKDVEQAIKKTFASLEIFHLSYVDDDHTCDSCIVIDQRPQPGALIYDDKPLTIQLQVMPQVSANNQTQTEENNSANEEPTSQLDII